MGGRFNNRRSKLALPRSEFRCISIDAPWPEQGSGRVKRGADRHYPLLKTPEIIRVIYQSGVWRPAASAHIYVWATDNYLKDAIALMEALGFRYIRVMVWIKASDGNLQMGIGQYMRGSHELCLLGVRGRARLPEKAPRSVVAARTEHSRKPDEAYAVMEQISRGPRLEMFARRPRKGWTVWGNGVKPEASGDLAGR